MNDIELSQAQRDLLRDRLSKYCAETFDLELEQFDAEFFVDFIAKELPVPLMNKYFEYQTQLCHGYESAPDPQAWERENCFLKI